MISEKTDRWENATLLLVVLAVLSLFVSYLAIISWVGTEAKGVPQDDQGASQPIDQTLDHDHEDRPPIPDRDHQDQHIPDSAYQDREFSIEDITEEEDPQYPHDEPFLQAYYYEGVIYVHTQEPEDCSTEIDGVQQINEHFIIIDISPVDYAGCSSDMVPKVYGIEPTDDEGIDEYVDIMVDSIEDYAEYSEGAEDSAEDTENGSERSEDTARNV